MSQADTFAGRFVRRAVAAAAPGLCAIVGLLSSTVHAGELTACQLRGVPHEARCGFISRPLDPANPTGPHIDVHVAVLPALARNKLADPIFFFAGGPGQSAIDLAGPIHAMLARFGHRRDIVLVDQRGTGRSAPLECAKPDPRLPLAKAADVAFAVERLHACAVTLRKLPHGDLRQYTTSIAMADVEAVRAFLGSARINVVGASYGTRAALEYMRLYPDRVRSAVLDGVAPPDMGLPRSFSLDNQAALDAVFTACETDTVCTKSYPSLRLRWKQVLASLPKFVAVRHPSTGEEERFELSRSALLGAVRRALYVPALTSTLPGAIDAASRGRFGPVLALSMSWGRHRIAEGMHFSVVCAEDQAAEQVSANIDSEDFRDEFDRFYRAVCSSWPNAKVSKDFFTILPSAIPTLLLSGGDDPATPPRHGERVAQALGPKAAHLVVPHAGHGLINPYACVRDAIYRFVETADQAMPPKPELACADRIPRAIPYPFAPTSAEAAAK